MKIGIHHTAGTFSDRWLSYCRENNIDFKLINCYSNNIVQEIHDCEAILWHHFQTSPRSIIVARQILFALEHAGIRVFPDFKTAWHFDDKLGQKYLLEAIDAPLVPSYAFFDQKTAFEWVKNAEFPKVFKLRGGAGSSNVRLIKTPQHARKIVRKAFSKGFRQYDPWTSLNEAIQKFKSGNSKLIDLAKGVAHLLIQPQFAKVMGRSRGYVYFQDFVKNNDHDIRVVVIANKAFAIKRLVRKNDFRASGSGLIQYDKDFFNEQTIKLAFDLTNRLKGQSIAFDFVYENSQPKLLEISYGFVPEGYDECPGYWDIDLIWHPGKFDPYGWIIEALIR